MQANSDPVPAAPAPVATMYVYPWDLLDEGIDRALDNIHSCGIDGIQIALSYHIATYLLPRNPKRCLYFGNHGAIYFRPDDRLYSGTNIKPRVAEIIDQPNYLHTMIRAAGERGIRTTAWVVYCYNHRLAREESQYAKRNVFGDPDHAQLCVANQEVREYALALTRDILQNYAFDGFLAESLSYLSFGYGFLNPKMSITLPARIKQLLGLCFCEHCTCIAREKGIDVAWLSETLQSRLRKYLNSLPDGIGNEDPAPVWESEVFRRELGAFLEMRMETATSLLEQVLVMARQSGKRVGYSGIVEADTDMAGISLKRISPLLDEVSIGISPSTSRQELEARLRAVRERFPEPTKVYALIQPGSFASFEGFLQTIRLALGAGVRHLSFYNYGMLTARQLEWIAEASKEWRK